MGCLTVGDHVQVKWQKRYETARIQSRHPDLGANTGHVLLVVLARFPHVQLVVREAGLQLVFNA